MTKAILWFGYSWIAAAVIIEIVGLLGILFTRGFWELASILSPLNIVQWLFSIALFAPGIAAIAWAQKRSELAR